MKRSKINRRADSGSSKKASPVGKLPTCAAWDHRADRWKASTAASSPVITPNPAARGVVLNRIHAFGSRLDRYLRPVNDCPQDCLYGVVSLLSGRISRTRQRAESINEIAVAGDLHRDRVRNRESVHVPSRSKRSRT
jgi:hypothetical protein